MHGSHIQHLYGDTYHIDIEDTETPKNATDTDTDIEEQSQSQSDGDSDVIHSVLPSIVCRPTFKTLAKTLALSMAPKNSIDYSEYEELPV